MDKNQFELRSLVYFVLVCYTANLTFSIVGVASVPKSTLQLLLYQLSSAFAITGSVMAARYIGIRGQHVAASGCILLGITHGVGMASLGMASINVDRGALIFMPMMPALVSMFWCTLLPFWLRLAGTIPFAFFLVVYVTVRMGGEFYSWPLNFAYGTLQVLEVIWSVYFYRDWKTTSQAGKA
jgi:hypothetical protein